MLRTWPRRPWPRKEQALSSGGTARRRLRVEGAVQGVGFRPFVYRLAADLGLAGFVENTPAASRSRWRGRRRSLDGFVPRLRGEAPARARIDTLEDRRRSRRPAGLRDPRQRRGRPPRRPWCSPDSPPAPPASREMFDPADRRHRYPFINCTHCGPRFSVVRGLPYDRARTTMAGFALCAALPGRVRGPARPPLPRRSPSPAPTAARSSRCATPTGALANATTALRAGGAALARGARRGAEGPGRLPPARGRARRGGGARACASASSARRSRCADGGRPRPARALCEVAPPRRALLPRPRPRSCSCARRRRRAARRAESVAPGNPRLGVMLPYTPLHHLLLRELGSRSSPPAATAATSRSAPTTREALARLAGIADLFLVHDRPVARPLDDSVVRLVAGAAVAAAARARLRAAAGAPPAAAPWSWRVGGHLKNTVALAIGASRGAEPARRRPRHAAAVGASAGHRGLRACSTSRRRRGLRRSTPTTSRPEAARRRTWACRSCRAAPPRPRSSRAWPSTGSTPPALARPGTAPAGARTARSGAARSCAVTPAGLRARGALRPSRCPAATRPARAAAVGRWGCSSSWRARSCWRARTTRSGGVPARERAVVGAMLARAQRPRTSSVGRLFDAVAALSACDPRGSFEGQAAMELEGARPRRGRPSRTRCRCAADGRPGRLDWGPLVQALDGPAARVPVAISRRGSTTRSRRRCRAGRPGGRSAGCCSRAAACRTGPCRARLRALRAAGFEGLAPAGAAERRRARAGTDVAALRAPRGA